MYSLVFGEQRRFGTWLERQYKESDEQHESRLQTRHKDRNKEGSRIALSRDKSHRTNKAWTGLEHEREARYS